MTKEELKKYFNENPLKDIYKNDHSNALAKAEGDYPCALLFYSIHKILPNSIAIDDYETGPYFDEFINDFEINKEHIIKKEFFNVNTGELEANYTSIILLGEMIIRYKPNSYGATIFYSPSIDPKIIEYFKETAKKYAVKLIMDNPLYVLCDDNGKLAVRRNRPPELKDVNLELSYNDDLLQTNKIIVQRLSKEGGTGVVLLHGPAGTGKTSYIRYLMGVIKKKFLYVPTDYAHYLGSKEFMSLLFEHKDTILIIEDAESVIKPRTEHSSSATANLLNLGDGLLSEVLAIQIILTFNTELSNIDSALLRKGRIIARQSFSALSIEKAQSLSDSLGYKTEITNEMTLAEIYNQNEEDYSGTTKKQIGFGIKG